MSAEKWLDVEWWQTTRENLVFVYSNFVPFSITHCLLNISSVFHRVSKVFLFFLQFFVIAGVNSCFESKITGNWDELGKKCFILIPVYRRLQGEVEAIKPLSPCFIADILTAPESERVKLNLHLQYYALNAANVLLSSSSFSHSSLPYIKTVNILRLIYSEVIRLEMSN